MLNIIFKDFFKIFLFSLNIVFNFSNLLFGVEKIFLANKKCNEFVFFDFYIKYKIINF